jgi:hypothetical protein
MLVGRAILTVKIEIEDSNFRALTLTFDLGTDQRNRRERRQKLSARACFNKTTERKSQSLPRAKDQGALDFPCPERNASGARYANQ